MSKNENKNDIWIEKFKANLLKQDMSERTINGYLYDLKVFKTWMDDFYQQPIDFIQITTTDLQAYREYLVRVKRYKVSSINRRIQAIKRFYSWLLKTTKNTLEHPAKNIRFMRSPKRTQPTTLTRKEVNRLLTAAGQSLHGLAKRNKALVQLILQSGMRIGEVAQLQKRDLVVQERSGYVKVVDGKGHKFREIPLNTAARRALKDYFETLNDLNLEDYVFISKRCTPQTIRGIQKILQSIVKRADITRIPVSAHTLRHTFAANYLNANPGALVALSTLLGHDSLNTTAIYTKVSREDLSESVEKSELNLQME